MSEGKSKTPKFLKAGKVVLLLNGRMAGKKAVIVKTFDEGTTDRPYGYCLVAGNQKYPLKITKSMSEKKIAKRSKVRAVDCYPPSPALAIVPMAVAGICRAPPRFGLPTLRCRQRERVATDGRCRCCRQRGAPSSTAPPSARAATHVLLGTIPSWCHFARATPCTASRHKITFAWPLTHARCIPRDVFSGEAVHQDGELHPLHADALRSGGRAQVHRHC